MKSVASPSVRSLIFNLFVHSLQPRCRQPRRGRTRCRFRAHRRAWGQPPSARADFSYPTATRAASFRPRCLRSPRTRLAARWRWVPHKGRRSTQRARPHRSPRSSVALTPRCVPDPCRRFQLTCTCWWSCVRARAGVVDAAATAVVVVVMPMGSSVAGCVRLISPFLRLLLLRCVGLPPIRRLPGRGPIPPPANRPTRRRLPRPIRTRS